MTEQKDLFTSKTTWGVLIALSAPLLPQLGLEIGNQEELASMIVSLIGAVLAIVGNVTRTKQIGSIAGMKIK